MRKLGSAWLVSVSSVLLAIACSAPAGGTQSGSGQAAPSAARGPLRVTMADFREPAFIPYSAVPGSYEIRNLVNPGLSVLDDRGTLQPVLAEVVPSLQNGLWKLAPDGQMETTWRIRPGALWHDGTELTTADLLFTIQVGRDRSAGAFSHPAYASVANVTAPDAQTIVVTWREPYIDADQMFSIWLGWPLPKHVLESPYRDEPSTLIESPFWTQNYVGSGPYRLKEYAPGQRVSLEAFDQFILGHPKIDAIDVVYMPDPSTVLAGLLAGTLDLTDGIGIEVDAANEFRDRWTEKSVNPLRAMR